MSQDKIEFKILETKLIGNNVVIFRAEDGATIKARVFCDSVALAIDYRNPDGSPHYRQHIQVNVTTIPPDRKFFVPKSEMQPQQPNQTKPPDGKYG